MFLRRRQLIEVVQRLTITNNILRILRKHGPLERERDEEEDWKKNKI